MYILHVARSLLCFTTTAAQKDVGKDYLSENSAIS